MNIWDKMLVNAKKVQNKRSVSPFIDAGSVEAAILTDTEKIYVGVSIDTSSSLGMCAERNAIANMITNGESRIKKVLAVMSDGKVGPPCCACREYLMQLDKNSKNIEVLMNYDPLEINTLGELCPSWWTDSKFD